MKLHYKKLGEGQPLIILHGLLGMLDNWLTPAKILSEDYEVFLIDQRNHGHSPHSNEFNYQVMADDLYEFFHEHFLADVILMGHSMGGKTAMKFVQQNPLLVEKLIVADIAPKKYPVKHDKILRGLSAVDFDKVKSRSEVEAILHQHIPEEGIRQFLLKSLYWKEKGRLAWRFNLDAIRENIEHISEEITEGVFEKPALFIRGELSDYIDEQDMELIREFFPKAELATVPEAGHWLHAEKPEAFLDQVKDFLKRNN